MLIITRRFALIYSCPLPLLEGCGPSPTLSGGFKKTTYQSYRDKLFIKIGTTIIFKENIDIFATRLLDYLARDGNKSIDENDDASFLLNKPYEMIGRRISTKFGKAQIIDLKRSKLEAVLRYRALSDKVSLRDIPKDAPSIPSAVNAKYNTDYRWIIISDGRLIYSLSSPNKLFSELNFEISVEQFHLLRWDKTEGDWIDENGLQRLARELLMGLDGQWLSLIEDRFSLPRGTVTISNQPTAERWEQEPCKSCWL